MPSRPRSPPEEIDPVRFKKSVETSDPFSTTRIRPACSTTNCRELLVESWMNATGAASPDTYTRLARFDCAATLGPRTIAVQTITTEPHDRSNCMIARHLQESSRSIFARRTDLSWFECGALGF